MPMPHVNLIYKLDGDVDEGIDVFSLAPVLLNLGRLIQDSNRILNPAGKDIAVNVKPFEQGSFIIDISVVAVTNLEQLVSFVQGNDLRNLETLLKCIGLVSGGGIGLYQLMKFLKGKPKSFQQVSPDIVSYTANSGNSVTVNVEVHNLFRHPEITSVAADSLVDTLSAENITSVQTYLKTDEEATKVVFDKNDAAALASFSHTPTQEPTFADGGDKILNKSVIFLNPKNVNVEGGHTAWTFRKAGSREIVRAQLVDESFLDKLKTAEVRLASRDVLKVEMVEKQTRKDGVFHLSKEITHVIEYEQSPIQTTMMLENIQDDDENED